MTLLALDIAGLCGWALGGPADGAPRTGTWLLHGLDDYGLDRSLATLHETVREFCRCHSVEIVAIEAPMIPHNRSSHTAVALISLVAVARAAAHRHGSRLLLAHVQTVRKHFCGEGRPDNPKLAVMERCRLLGWSAADDNCADAAALWCWAMSKSYPRWSPKGTPMFAERASA
jgi:Holliday junction resolvasome RuvABC endonuclease subunit